MKEILFITLVLIWPYSQSKEPNQLPAQPLIDANGKIVSLSDFRGKVTVLDFWFTGCINCMKFFQQELSNAERHFVGNSSIVFISICIDKDRDTWLRSLEKGRYASKESVNLYTDGMGDQHPVVKMFQVVSYPQPIVLDREGHIISRSDSLTQPDKLIEAIEAGLKN
jgi:cytochrome oxidase Cu insertion factor (SCO1/SenC/PrrC family)